MLLCLTIYKTYFNKLFILYNC